MLRALAIAAAVGAVVAGCNSGAKNTMRSGSNKAAAQDSNVDPGTNPDADNSAVDAALVTKFPIFDPNYNFLSVSSTDPALVNNRYPVLDGAHSPTAILRLDDLLAERWKLLNDATRSVRIQALIFYGDEAGWTFADKLIELKNRGIAVWIMVDPMVNTKPETQRLYGYLSANGIKVQGYAPLYTWPLVYGPASLTPEQLFVKGNQRFHAKYFVVDAEDPARVTALTGGANISNEYYRIDQRNSMMSMWRDQDVAVRGEAAVRIAAMFDRNYAEMQADANKNQSPLTSLASTLPLLAKTLGQADLFGTERESVDPTVLANFKTRAAIKPGLNWHTAAKLRVLEHQPKNGLYTAEDAYIDMINHSTVSIDIANAYFIPSEALIRALQDAVRRGVKVRILSNSTGSTDAPEVVTASRTFYQRLLDANDQGAAGHLSIYEWGGEKSLHNGEGLLHSKFAVFDGQASIIGSYNLDPRSRNWDTEDIVVALDNQGAQELTAIYAENVMPKNAVEISAEDLRRFAAPDGDILNDLMNGFVSLAVPFL